MAALVEITHTLTGLDRRRLVIWTARSFKEGFNRPEGDEYFARLVEGELNDGHRYLVALDGERVLGGVSGRPWGEYRSGRHRTWEVYHVWVVPGAEDGTLGQTLLVGMIDFAHAFYRGLSGQGARLVFLLTHDLPRPTDRAGPAYAAYLRNRAARSLYSRVGFQRCALLPGFFRSGVDEAVYARYLPEND